MHFLVSAGCFLLCFTFPAVIECFLGCWFVFCEIGRLPEPKPEIGQQKLSDLRNIGGRHPISQKTGQLGYTSQEMFIFKINPVRSEEKNLKPCPISKKCETLAARLKRLLKRRLLEKIPGQLEASFLIFLTPRFIQQSNTPKGRSILISVAS